MKIFIIIDTGVIVAYLSKSDKFHQWAKVELSKINPPLLTCEAVVVESCFLLKSTYGVVDLIFSLLRTKQITIPFSLTNEMAEVEVLMKRYENVPMSLADACLVRMSELIPGSVILTLDSDFRIYRKNRNEAIDLIIPVDL
ncbi:MAG: PIN domain-containing protein [Trichodesmium sp. MAG_R03]|nr:PIN domain-containing protein [Trichodesmium sp. MAG_R03]MDE5084229.1 PIN domain-containing protein [Trichodesmium sp. St18_bin1]MDE5106420.1 PIN domain-containing protein [Trichodesmium sp. St17_bin3_1_1]